jgi:hypothetical protein
MDAQSPALRELSLEECERTSGGLWGVVALFVGAAAAGAALAVLTTEKEEVLVPKIDLPPSEEPVGW